GRPDHRANGVRAPRRLVARPGIEREARRHVCVAGRARPCVPLSHRGGERRPPGRRDLARQRLSERARRPDTHVAAARATGGAAGGAYALAQVESEPLSNVLVEMDRESDNFTAELLLKEIGAEVRGVGSTAAGAAIVLRDLGAAGVPLQGVLLFDGSGLSADDRFTARALAGLLLAAWNDPEVRTPFLRALPVAGVNGTLEDRMQKRPARGVVRAKTGTTSRASALSGYVGKRYAFAVVQNGF